MVREQRSSAPGGAASRFCIGVASADVVRGREAERHLHCDCDAASPATRNVVTGDNRVHFEEQYVHRFSDDRSTICLGSEPHEVAETSTCLAFVAGDGDMPQLRPGGRVLAGWVAVYPPADSDVSGGSYLVFVEPLD